MSGDYPDVPEVLLDPDTADPLPREPWTELGFARRLVTVHGARLRYVVAWRRWLVWDGTRWTADDTGQAARCAKQVARRMHVLAKASLQQATTKQDQDVAEGQIRASRKWESAGGIAGCLTLASTERGIAVTPADLDADPYLLNVANGTLDLRTGELREHDPRDLITKVTRAASRPDARGQAFDGFLARVQPGEDMRAYLARLLGHALVGRVIEHVLPIFHGIGANGKSTLVDAVLYALGDYAGPADADLIVARSFEAHPTGVADLFGRRLATLVETDQGRRLAEGMVKRLTSSEDLKARRMREDFWSFRPSHTIVMLTNHKPVVRGTDEGIWRRLRLVPWPVVIPEAERDGDLPTRLAAEADAVLSWLVDGYRQWAEDGLADPESVVTATAGFRADSDVLARFLDDRCLIGPHYRVRSSELYADWRSWCVAAGEEPGTDKAFTAAIEERGYDKRRTNIGAVWHGIGLMAGDETAGQDEG